MEKPVILITNDDGVNAKGIASLIEFARPFGNLVVVAPDRSRSCMSMAITATEPMRLHKLREEVGLTVYSCTGTPVDCVKLAFFALFKEKRPDLLLSGINHGSNSSVNAVYSGTMGAAMEGCINSVPSVGLSLCEHDLNADFEPLRELVRRIISFVLQNSLPHGVCLNVNFPAGKVEGLSFCRQSVARWSEEYVAHTQADGGAFYTLAGYFDNREPEATDTDEWALSHNRASVVPMKVDRTDMDFVNVLKNNLL